MRMISPLRTYQVTPLASRSRVMRRVTSSTVPIASPVSITSPTPYWSSKIMKTPDRKSLTRLWAPKPSATPATPADASSGAMGMSSRSMTVRAARVTTTAVMMLRSSEPTVSTRWRWRSPASPVAVARARPARPDSARRCADFEVMVRTTRSISRRSSHRATPASTMVSEDAQPDRGQPVLRRLPGQVDGRRGSGRAGAASAVTASVTRVTLLGRQGPHHRVAVLDDEAAQGGGGVRVGVEPGLGAVAQRGVGERARVEAVDDRLDQRVRAAVVHGVEQGVVALDERAQQVG